MAADTVSGGRPMRLLLACLCVAWSSAAISADITLQAFEAALSRDLAFEVGGPKNSLSPLECQPFPAGGKMCLTRLGTARVGAMITVKTRPDSEVVLSAFMAIANPAFSANSNQVEAVHIVAVARLVSVFSPELPEAQRDDSINALLEGVPRFHGGWIYVPEDAGPLVSLTIEPR